MAEYIEREAAIQAASIWNGDEGTEAWIQSALQKLPAADVRPVVFCRDCKYYNDETCDRWSDGTYLNPNDFCSRAAKREES